MGHKKDAHFDEKMAKEKGISSDGSDLQPYDPPRKNLNVNTEPSQSSKPVKTSSGRGMSATRKKNYDPDVFFKVNGKLYQKLGIYIANDVVDDIPSSIGIQKEFTLPTMLLTILEISHTHWR